MNMLYDDAVRTYIRDRLALGRAKGTVRQNRMALRYLGASLPSGIRVESITEDHLDAWVSSMADLAPGTRRGRITAVSVFFKWCLRRGFRADDPTVWLERPRLERNVPRALKREQVIAAFAACKDPRDRLMLSLTVMEGLRVMEVAGLERSDIDARERLMLVRGKGRKERVVPITDDTLAALRAYDAWSPPMGARSVVRQLDGPWSSARRGVQPPTVSRVITRICQDAGIKQSILDGVSAHAFRHTCLTDIYRDTRDIRLVQELAGHESVATTQIYVGLTPPDEMRAAVAGRSFR